MGRRDDWPPSSPVRCSPHHERFGAACADRDEVALEPPEVEVSFERHDHQDAIDVGRDGLRLRALAGGLAEEGRATGQDALDDDLVASLGRWADEHPVADGDAALDGHLAARDARNGGHAGPGLGPDVDSCTIHRSDARGAEALGDGPRRGPAEVLEGEGRSGAGHAGEAWHCAGGSATLVRSRA